MSGFEAMTDDTLYKSYLRGETTAYDHLMIRYGDSLVLYLNGYLHDWHEAEDLMIEAFARIMAKKPTIRGGNFKAYLFRTGRNLALRFQDRKRRLQVFSLDGAELDSVGSVFASGAGADHSGGPIQQRLAEKERNRVLQICLERIEPELKEALWLVYIEEMSYEQAAAVMGVKMKRIDYLLAKAKQHMREELKKEGVINAYE